MEAQSPLPEPVIRTKLAAACQRAFGMDSQAPSWLEDSCQQTVLAVKWRSTSFLPTKSLDLSGNLVSRACLVSLCQGILGQESSACIQNLRLSGCYLPADSFKVLNPADGLKAQLKRLDLSSNPALNAEVSNAHMVMFITACQHLELLSLHHTAAEQMEDQPDDGGIRLALPSRDEGHAAERWPDEHVMPHRPVLADWDIAADTMDVDVGPDSDQHGGNPAAGRRAPAAQQHRQNRPRSAPGNPAQRRSRPTSAPAPPRAPRSQPSIENQFGVDVDAPDLPDPATTDRPRPRRHRSRPRKRSRTGLPRHKKIRSDHTGQLKRRRRSPGGAGRQSYAADASFEDTRGAAPEHAIYPNSIGERRAPTGNHEPGYHKEDYMPPSPRHHAPRRKQQTQRHPRAPDVRGTSPMQGVFDTAGTAYSLSEGSPQCSQDLHRGSMAESGSESASGDSADDQGADSGQAGSDSDGFVAPDDLSEQELYYGRYEKACSVSRSGGHDQGNQNELFDLRAFPDDRQRKAHPAKGLFAAPKEKRGERRKAHEPVLEQIAKAKQGTQLLDPGSPVQEDRAPIPRSQDIERREGLQPAGAGAAAMSPGRQAASQGAPFADPPAKPLTKRQQRELNGLRCFGWDKRIEIHPPNQELLGMSTTSLFRIKKPAQRYQPDDHRPDTHQQDSADQESSHHAASEQPSSDDDSAAQSADDSDDDGQREESMAAQLHSLHGVLGVGSQLGSLDAQDSALNTRLGAKDGTFDADRSHGDPQESCEKGKGAGQPVEASPGKAPAAAVHASPQTASVVEQAAGPAAASLEDSGQHLAPRQASQDASTPGVSRPPGGGTQPAARHRVSQTPANTIIYDSEEE
ncbi:hypothetical protein WJX73_009379 [Symbiochloris irregularis]|uniref:Uncharacterized protein n=1 Tax=Symbiochloris irregularis TaxID=706552 RepID=A0AAW1Q101_9CHLO